MATTQSSPPSQRKQATILFADLSGFTALSERLDPEEVRTLVNRYFESLTEVVRRYGGTVDKYMGDCLMTVFGAPKAHENDPERACRAALDMMGVAKEISSDSELGLKSSALHISVNSGLVVAAPVGSAEASQYTVMGDAVNVASRLLHEAEEGEIVVGEPTWHQVSGLFDFGPRSERSVKGKSEKVGFYQLFRVATKPVVQGRGLQLPMVGRRRELTMAESLLEEAVSGRGGFLYITGEAGIGKSRLVEEIESSAKGRGFLAVSALAEVFESLQPYDLWRQVLFSLAEVAAETPDVDARKQIEAWIQRTPELENHKPALLATCGFATKEFELVDEESRKRSVSLAWKVLLQTLQDHQPVLLVLDDLQWADSASLVVLDAVAESVQGLRVLICGVARPEFKLEWSTRSYVQQIALRPLSSEESSSLVHEVTGERKLDPAQEKWVAERAEGNPFYVAELTRVVADRGTTELPPTVQGIILQRVDRLEQEARQILEVASVIGREFPEKVLRAVADVKELETKLDELRQLEFFYEKQIVPELQYIFKHYLTQEATYNSILVERRKQLHKQVGEAIEAVYKDSLERNYGVLAQHLEKAGEYQKAFDYYRRAGEHAQQAQSDTAAASFYKRGESALEKLYVGGAALRGKGKQFLQFAAMIFVSILIGFSLSIDPSRLDWGLVLSILLMALVVAGGVSLLFAYSIKTWSFIVYPDKLRIKKGQNTRDISFDRVEDVAIVSWREWAGWKKAVPTLWRYLTIVFDPRYQGMGISQSMKMPGILRHAVKVKCGGFKWRLGCFMEMDDAHRFYETLTRALERYRAIHGSAQ
jgi:class 3 adenylate cyclase